jgi:hypothetical protein
MRSLQGARYSPRLSDEELEYYGEVYLRAALGQFGVDFETFLENPEYYLHKYAKGHPAISGKDGESGKKGLLRLLGLRHMPRTPSK